MPAKTSDTLKMYALIGIVKAVKPKTGKITVHNTHIYSTHIHGPVDPMERDYVLRDTAAFSRVKEGDCVRATLLTDSTDIWLLDEATFAHKPVRARRRA